VGEVTALVDSRGGYSARLVEISDLKKLKKYFGLCENIEVNVASKRQQWRRLPG